jgi:hypothetical protein
MRGAMPEIARDFGDFLRATADGDDERRRFGVVRDTQDVVHAVGELLARETAQGSVREFRLTAIGHRRCRAAARTARAVRGESFTAITGLHEAVIGVRNRPSHSRTRPDVHVHRN